MTEYEKTETTKDVDWREFKKHFKGFIHLKVNKDTDHITLSYTFDKKTKVPDIGYLDINITYNFELPCRFRRSDGSTETHFGFHNSDAESLFSAIEVSRKLKKVIIMEYWQKNSYDMITKYGLNQETFILKLKNKYEDQDNILKFHIDNVYEHGTQKIAWSNR